MRCLDGRAVCIRPGQAAEGWDTRTPVLQPSPGALFTRACSAGCGENTAATLQRSAARRTETPYKAVGRPIWGVAVTKLGRMVPGNTSCNFQRDRGVLCNPRSERRQGKHMSRCAAQRPPGRRAGAGLGQREKSVEDAPAGREAVCWLGAALTISEGPLKPRDSAATSASLSPQQSF